MPIYEIRNFKETKNSEKRVAMLLALHGAPILRGIKMANLLTIKKSDIRTVQKILAGTKIAYRFLKSKNDYVILYLYRPKELDDYLFDYQARRFLKGYGYDGNSIEELLHELAKRIILHSDGREEFPHEIGVFLGYPLEDVKGFLVNKGEDYSYVGYWKVYHNVEEALQTFKKYDKERDFVVEQVIMGKTIREIAV